MEGTVSIDFLRPIFTLCIHHPFLRMTLTFPTTWLKPILNLFLHLSLFNLFLFSPPRSWNTCLAASFRTLFCAQVISKDLIPLPKSTPRFGLISMVRPTLGRERMVREARVAGSCECLYSFAISFEILLLDVGKLDGISIALASAPGLGLGLP